jgi:hypothetical protein
VYGATSNGHDGQNSMRHDKLGEHGDIKNCGEIPL